MKKQMKISVFSIAIGALVVFGSCGPKQEKQVAAEESVEATAAKVVGNEKKQDKPPVFKDENMAKVYGHYLHLKDALVNTDAAQAQKAATALKSALNVLKAKEETLKLAGRIAASPSVEEQRKAFSPLSDAINELIKNAGLSSGEIYLAFCPMANGNAGAFWLSNDKEIKNPYFGDKMMKCGSVKQTIAANM